MVRQIAAVQLDDGLVFDAAAAGATVIRDEDSYSGVRVGLTGSLASACLALPVDVNVGDPIHPGPQALVVPRLLGGQLTVRGYPLTMVLVEKVEKIVTAVQRGPANTRWRDYADLYLLAERHDVDADDLHAAITAVADYRQVVLLPLAQVLEGFAERTQSRWGMWRRRQRLEAQLPAQFAEVLEQVIALADPVLTAPAPGARWDASTGAWNTQS